MATGIALHARPRGEARRTPRRPGDGATFELSCSTCGYGVVVRMAPDYCPMCHGSVWEHPLGAFPRLSVTAA